MKLQKVLLLFLLVTCFALNGQKQEFGKLTTTEKQFQVYEKDTTANAVVLFEKGDNYFEIIKGRLRLVKEYHGRIKILKKGGLDEATIEIPYYHNRNSFEQVDKIRAVTHNGEAQTFLNKDQIFTVELNERWTEKKFTFPNAKVGSILEYTYRVVTPFTYNFNGWNFQTHIPKLYSEFNAKIPGNYVYNRTLIGPLKLSVNEASEMDNCLYIQGISKNLACEVLKYVMKDIPAFKEEEEFMLASSNYKSRLDFELSVLYHLDGAKEEFTKSWEDVDREFRTDPDIGRQLGKKSYYEKMVPTEIFNQEDPLRRAKMIYNYVQKYFNWNGEYGIYKDIDVKDAFEQRSGNIGEINITLINLLNLSGIKTNLALLSTRKNGLPKKSHPVISDFNYIIAKAEINGESYLLDASDKLIPFGMLPFRCLNYYARVMDFKSDSYWYDIVANKKNSKTVRLKLNIDTENQLLTGSVEDINLGYESVQKSKRYASMSEDAYLSELEQGNINEMSIINHELVKDAKEERKVTEIFDFELEQTLQANTLYIDPFVIKFFKSNPFSLETRNYPIDFGYPRRYAYYLNMPVPAGYSIKELPVQKIVTLPENSGVLRFNCSENNGSINLNLSIAIKSPHFSARVYDLLKEFFSEINDIENNSLIVLERTTD